VKTLSESRALRLVTFAALYFAQGVPWGFVTVAYVVFLADQGLGKADIGEAISIAYMPWAFKILAGPVIDRFPTRRFGRRRHFIIGAELLMGATLLALPFFDPHAGLWPIHALLFAHNSFAAIQDASTDALAVDVLPARERGKANSVMWAAKVGGSATGGSLGVLLAKHLGWTTLFIIIAIIVWAVVLLVVFVRERPPGDAEAAAEERLELRVVFRSFAWKTPIVGVAISLVAPIGYALVATIYTATLRSDLHLGDDAIASLTFVDTPVGVGGALLGGFVADRFGVRKTMGVCLVGIGASLAVFAASKSLWPSMTFLFTYTIVSSLFQYAYNAASLGFFMSISNPAIGATQFSLYMAAANVTYSWTARAGGWMGEHLGVAQTFAIAAVIQVASVALLPFCNPRDADARFRRS
jgi:PAT family beta-lactamase induction signal transducer AmpG